MLAPKRQAPVVPRCCRALEFIIRQQLHLLSQSVFNDLVLRELAHYKFIKTAETTASERMGRGVAAADGGDDWNAGVKK